MKTKLISCLFAVVMLCAFSTVAMADPVYFGQVTITPGNPYIVNVVGGGSFESFCLEMNEFIAGGNIYDAYLNPAGAVAGGNGGGNPDPLDIKTIYMYTNFMSGASYNPAALQVAIWFVEDESPYDVVSYQSYKTLADSYIAAAEADIANGWQPTGGVYALNLYTLAGAKAQDFLTIPEPMSLLLLGFGLLGLGITRRKLKK